MKPAIDPSILEQFTGSGNLYRHRLVRRIHFTDGIKYVADAGDAYWLIDEIVSAQLVDGALWKEELQVWNLRVNKDRSAELICYDGSGNVLLTQRIEETDFPLPEVRLYYTGQVIMLPSEHRDTCIRRPR